MNKFEKLLDNSFNNYLKPIVEFVKCLISFDEYVSQVLQKVRLFCETNDYESLKNVIMVSLS